ncbi:hypothetical protein RhiirA1_402311 [Rhizophagus irregularis]|uniref:Fido domain-containing protein n=1 Tax=Rhizophagus irregularis TaxID=588596 RepID=A0A2N0QYQ3_9GLOM|nr:hypothetical protein RhiirA1_402311 [Rhizophagus irregularis]
MAAGFVESIIKNHPFIDGNKRAAHLAVELKRKRFKQPMYKEIDDAVGIWMSQFLAANQILRGDILQKKAKQFADRFEFAEFIAFAALFWQLEPSKTLAQGPVTETKKSKN